MSEYVTIHAVKLGTRTTPLIVTDSQTVRLDLSEVPEITRNLFLTQTLPMYDGPPFDLIMATNSDRTFGFHWDWSVEMKFDELCRQQLRRQRLAEGDAQL